MAKRIPLHDLIIGLSLVSMAAFPALAAKNPTLATADLLDGSGAGKGQARLVVIGDRLELKVDVAGLPAGQHGVHLHAVGSCNAPDFTSAGPHLNPAGKMHGSMNPQGSHLGDLPNLAVDSAGKGTLTVPIPGSRAETEPLLFDGDGTAVVVHAAADDHRTDPSGNSGARIACGVLTRAR